MLKFHLCFYLIFLTNVANIQEPNFHDCKRNKSKSVLNVVIRQCFIEGPNNVTKIRKYWKDTMVWFYLTTRSLQIETFDECTKEVLPELQAEENNE